MHPFNMRTTELFDKYRYNTFAFTSFHFLGQKWFFLNMIVLPLIPITALVIQNSVTMNTILSYQGRVESIRAQVSSQMLPIYK